MSATFCHLCYAEDTETELFYLCRRSVKHVFCGRCIHLKHRQSQSQKIDFRCPCCQSLIQKYEELESLSHLLQKLSL